MDINNLFLYYPTHCSEISEIGSIHSSTEYGKRLRGGYELPVIMRYVENDQGLTEYINVNTLQDITLIKKIW